MATNLKKSGRKASGNQPVQFGVPSEATLAETPDAATDEIVGAVLQADSAALAPIEIETPAVELPPVNMKEEAVYNETTTAETMTAEAMNTATEATTEATRTAGAMFGDMGARAKDMFAKGQSSMGDVVEFNKGNVEALVQSARTAATGWQNIASYTVDYAKTAIATANENTRRLASAKSPTEFAQVGQEIAKANLDETVAQVSKFAENYLKLVGEIVQPLQNRYALATEKVKSATVA